MHGVHRASGKGAPGVCRTYAICRTFVHTMCAECVHGCRTSLAPRSTRGRRFVGLKSAPSPPLLSDSGHPFVRRASCACAGAVGRPCAGTGQEAGPAGAREGRGLGVDGGLGRIGASKYAVRLLKVISSRKPLGVLARERGFGIVYESGKRFFRADFKRLTLDCANFMGCKKVAG